ncbi:rhomboid family intramembrane serine protease [Coraliomargarita akajimensis]|uniref:Rhomboid family protein n=1 Tax=Coraliomargarita akajimensis (strain DSM 45221 / IAM 15411 / JCM 23193 / KCTC 12865 / 04OKA010-24) TaxID=583355 RepID=D5ELK3_CORAD|nr:rhomboid family intramembrane serine protease [Coraliomargarita akajimensis]ADE55139.1 Rhomboid family protein [Coraliomargarita akajimensis DSM 45221]
MLYDRPYMRQNEPAGNSRFGQRPAYLILLFVTVGIFILQQLLNVLFPGASGRGNGFLTQWFALSGYGFQQFKLWTIWTYGFLHSTQGFFHILGNMLGLFFIGRMIEPVLGKAKFVGLYFSGALLGGLAYLFFHFNDGFPVVGASAAVLALLSFFCLLQPERPITLLLFFVLPVTIKPKWLFWAVLVISALGAIAYELPSMLESGHMTSPVAHSAHLGGMIAGILFYRYIYVGNGLPFLFKQRSSGSAAEPPQWFKSRPKSTQNLNYRVNRDSRQDLQAEVDRILDKINSSGFGALTEAEKSTLERAKDILSK